MTDIEKQLISDFKATFSGQFDAGIRVLKYLSKYCLENRTTFVEESGRKTDFNEGARSVILEIRRKLNTNIDKVKESELKNE